MTSKEFVRNYWNYYLQLEQQVLDTQSYVDFSAKNNSAYSIEYLQLFLAICSEIDVVAKVIAKESNIDLGGTSIDSWGPALDNALPGLQDQRVLFNDDYEVQPWKNWNHIKVYSEKKKKEYWKLANKCRNPEWWNEYNKVKHQRTSICSSGRTYYTKANLRNVVLSLAALRIVESTYLEQLIESDKLLLEYNMGKLYT